MVEAELGITARARDQMNDMLPKINKQLQQMEGVLGKTGGAMDRTGGQANKLAGHLDGVKAAADRGKGGIGGLVDMLGKVGLAGMGISALAGAAKGLGDTLGLGLNVEMENVEARLMAFTKDGGKAKDVLKDIRAEADKTPFAFKEMAKATAGLMPVAKAANEPLMDLVKTAEILAASNPAQGLEGAAFALREAVGGDFQSVIDRFDLPRQTINKFKDQGLPALDAVRATMKELGYDSDLVGNLAKTASGKWSTFQDTIDGLRSKLSEPLLEKLKEGLTGMQSWLDDNKATIEGWADTAANVLGGAAATAAEWLGKMGEALSTVRTVVEDLLSGKMDFATFANKVMDALGGLADKALAALTGQFQRIDWGATAQAVLDGLKRAATMFLSVTPLGVALGPIGQNVLQAIGKALDAVDWPKTWSVIVDALGKAGEWIQAKWPVFVAELDKLSQRFWTWITNQAQPILDKLGAWGKALVDWIVPATVKFLQEWPQMLERFLDWIGSAVPPLIGKLAEWAGAIIGWIAPMIPPLLLALGGILAALVVFVAETAFVLVKKLAEWGLKFVQWVAPMIPPLLWELGGLLLRLGGWILDTALPAIGRQLLEWAGAFVAWIEPMVPGVIKKLDSLQTDIGKWIIDAAGALLTEAGKIGDSIINGIKEGINNAWGSLKTAFDWLIGQLPQWVKDILKISSPSKVFFEIGEQIINGLIAGLKSRNTSWLDTIRNAIGNSISLMDSLIDRTIGGPNASILSRGASAADSLMKLISERFTGQDVMFGFPRIPNILSGISQQSQDMQVFGQIRDVVDAMREMGMTIDQEMIGEFRNLGQFLGGPVRDALDRFLGTLDQQDALKGLKDFLADADLGRQLASTASVLQSLGQAMPDSLRSLLENVPRIEGGVLDTIIKQLLAGAIPGFASGGVVPGALGAPRLIVAHGGEEVRTRAQRQGPQVVKQYYLTTYSNAPTDQTIANFRLMEAMA